MEKVIMENAYMTYDGQIRLDSHILIVSLWNKYIEDTKGYGSKVFPNDKNFFEENFENKYDAAMAVSLSGNWKWTDSFAYFDNDGYITSFSRLDDENCPIDIDKIDIDYLIRALQDLQKNLEKNKKKRYVVDNIPKAIHDALA